MRRMTPFLALALLIAPSANAGDIQLGQPFALAIGELVVVGDLPLIVRFDAILSDSRCPRDAVCVWEGEVTAQLTISSATGESASFELHTRFSPFGPPSAEFLEHVVTLRQVRPYPEIRGPIDPGDYRVELVVQLESALPTHPISWSALKGNFR